MAWLISRALMADFENSRSSPEQAGESSEGISSDGGQCAPSSETPMPQAYLSPDRTKEFSRLSRSGMTFAPLMADRGEAVLTWCLAGSLAKTSQQQDAGQASTASGRGSGVRWRELFRRFDPATSSWRTHRCLFDEGLPESSVILPRWGMMRDGALSERLTVALPTNGTASGLWPTPQASDNRSRGTEASTARRLRIGKQVGLEAMVKWHTPTAHNAKEGAYPAEFERKSPTLASQAGGALNPPWVEWLMGWPIGWTSLGPLGTDKFQQWLHSHGGSCRPIE